MTRPQGEKNHHRTRRRGNGTRTRCVRHNALPRKQYQYVYWEKYRLYEDCCQYATSMNASYFILICFRMYSSARELCLDHKMTEELKKKAKHLHISEAHLWNFCSEKKTYSMTDQWSKRLQLIISWLIVQRDSFFSFTRTSTRENLPSSAPRSLVIFALLFRFNQSNTL